MKGQKLLLAINNEVSVFAKTKKNRPVTLRQNETR